MERKNKVYEHPEMEVVKLEVKPLLAGSTEASGESGTVKGMYHEDVYDY